MTVAEDWFTHMRRGDFAAAWEISDAVLASRRGVPSWHLEREYQWIWDGSSLDGKRVLIRCYHGLGDTIQFARFLPRVARIAKEVLVWVQPSLIPLLRTLRAPLTLLPLHDGTPEAEYDVDVEIMELTHLFRTTVDTIPREIPYFHVEPMPRTHAIGVNLRAGDWGPQRTIPYDADFGASAISLQKGSDPRVDDPLSTARFIRSLELVISVDTMTAHLAGALGVPVWLLLPYEADWRWMNDREDSPWYPSMRIFRQSKPGEWGDVLDRVRVALA